MFLTYSSSTHFDPLPLTYISCFNDNVKFSYFLFQLAQKFNKLQQINGGSDAETELPPLPFDIEEMDKLVQESAVKALESK